MNKSIFLLSLLLTLCVACKRTNVDFSYSPTTPKAGQIIVFSNLCTEGEKWAWSFGDNSNSLAKNPNHIYKKPGSYIVTLMVDSAKHKTRAKEIIVYDTVPTFVCSTDSVLHYQDVTFTANVYNPFSYSLTYEWSVSENCNVLSSSMQGSKLVVYYKSSTALDSVNLLLTLNGKEYHITKHFPVHLTQAPAIVMQTADNSILRQRIFETRLEDCKPAVQEDYTYIQQANDTSVCFNGKTFYASTLANTITGFAGLDIQHIQLDAMAQKWYIVTNEGLFVANFDGAARVLVDANATGAIHIDTIRNCIYWASTNGLQALPLIKSMNNQFTTIPAQYNQLNNITRIIVDNTNR